MSGSLRTHVLLLIPALVSTWCPLAYGQEEVEDLGEQIWESVELLDLAEEEPDQDVARKMRERALDELLATEGRLMVASGVPPEMLRAVKRQLARAFCALGQSEVGLAKAREVEYLGPGPKEVEQIEELRESCAQGGDSAETSTGHSAIGSTHEGEPSTVTGPSPSTPVVPSPLDWLSQATERAIALQANGRLSEARTEWARIETEAKSVHDTTGDVEALYYGGWARYMLGEMRAARTPLAAYLSSGGQLHSREAWAIIEDIDARLLAEQEAAEQREAELESQRRYEEERRRAQQRQAEENRASSTVFASTPKIARPSGQSQAMIAVGVTVGLAGGAAVGLTYYAYTSTPEFTQQGWTGLQAGNVAGWVCIGTGVGLTIVGGVLAAESRLSGAGLGAGGGPISAMRVTFAPYPGGLVVEGKF